MVRWLVVLVILLNISIGIIGYQLGMINNIVIDFRPEIGIEIVPNAVAH